jgi:hypothetical protein
MSLVEPCSLSGRPARHILLVESFLPSVSIDPAGMICSFCGSWGEYNYQEDDFVTIPMLWCDGCGARSLLDVPRTEDSAVADLDAVVANCEEVDKEEVLLKAASGLTKERSRQLRFFWIPCFWIRGVVGSNTSNYRQAGSEKPTEQELRELIESRFDPAVMKRVGVRNATEREMWDSDDERPLDLALPCESYDAESPRVPYPAGMDLRHDGSSVHLLASRGERGEPFPARYWGC